MLIKLVWGEHANHLDDPRLALHALTSAMFMTWRSTMSQSSEGSHPKGTLKEFSQRGSKDVLTERVANIQ